MKINKPSFVVDRKKAVSNIKKIFEKAKKNNISLRPHFKTHQSAMIGEWFREFGIDKITVSSIDMAKYFYQNGWSDITIAFPLNILEIDEINNCFEYCNLNLLVCDEDTVLAMGEKLKRNVNVFIEIDMGMNRSGIYYNNFTKIENLIETITHFTHLKFKGFITHNGETYNLNKEQVRENYYKIKNNIKLLKNRFGNSIVFSIGDTPTVSIVEEFDDSIDEIRPGNFIYYDLMQYFIGSCKLDEIAAYVIAPVVSVDKEQGKIVLYCGAVHLSKESIKLEDKNIYGQIILIHDGEIKYTNNYIISLSQEHSVIKRKDDLLDGIKVGDLVGILPVHSCLVAAIFKDKINIMDAIIE